MTNFFDGALPQKVQLPAKRYPQFITAFEKAVETAQKNIRALERTEKPYIIAHEALEEASLPNDCKLNLQNGLIWIEVKACPQDCLRTFQPLVDAIGKRLFGAGLHRDGVPSHQDGGWDRRLRRQWTCQSLALDVQVSILVPEKGLVDITFETVERASIETEYKLIARSGHSLPVPVVSIKDEEVVF